MDTIFYSNIFCLFILLILIARIQWNREKMINQTYLRIAIYWTMITIIADMIARYVEGLNEAWAIQIQWISNIIYFNASTITGYYWLLFALTWMYHERFQVKQKLVMFIPAGVLLFVSLGTYWKGWMFTIDDQAVYARGPFLWVHWVVSLSYLLIPTLIALYKILRKWSNRREYGTIALFAIFPIIGAFMQIRFYGINTVSTGIVLAILLVGIAQQNNEIAVDALTGILNRRMISQQVNDRLRRAKMNDSFYLVMIDVDYFKRINDQLGHASGDEMLIELAGLLEDTCKEAKEETFVGRYGGDEFVIFSPEGSEEAVQELIHNINANLAIRNYEKDEKSKISLSIGYEQGSREKYHSADELFSLADAAMYRVKDWNHTQVRPGNENFGRFHVQTKYNAGDESQRLDVRNVQLNHSLILNGTLLGAVFELFYIVKMIRGQESMLTVFALLGLLAIVGWACMWYFHSHPEGTRLRYLMSFGALAVYTFIMLTGDVFMQAGFIILYLIILILYHQPSLVLSFGLIVAVMNIVGVSNQILTHSVTQEQFQEIEIQMIMIILSIVAAYMVATLYERVAKANAIYIEELREKNLQMSKVTVGSISTIANTIDAKDEYTRGHSQRVGAYSRQIALEMGATEEEADAIFSIALLHDIGKIGIPDEILNKNGELTDEEYALLQRHTVIGGEILRDLDVLEDVAVGARYHHERYDGAGYPDGLKGENIPFVARIIGLADAFDAMTSNRIYRMRLNYQRVLQELKDGTGKQFDPDVAKTAIRLLESGAFDDAFSKTDSE